MARGDTLTSCGCVGIASGRGCRVWRSHTHISIGGMALLGSSYHSDGVMVFLDHPGIETPFLRDSGCLNDSSHMFRGKGAHSRFSVQRPGLVWLSVRARAR